MIHSQFDCRDDLWQRLQTMNPRVFTSGELGELLSLVQIHKLDTLNNCFKSVGQATAGGPGGFIDTLVDNIRLAFPGLDTNSTLFCLLPVKQSLNCS